MQDLWNHGCAYSNLSSRNSYVNFMNTEATILFQSWYSSFKKRNTAKQFFLAAWVILFTASLCCCGVKLQWGEVRCAHQDKAGALTRVMCCWELKVLEEFQLTISGYFLTCSKITARYKQCFVLSYGMIWWSFKGTRSFLVKTLYNALLYSVSLLGLCCMWLFPNTWWLLANEVISKGPLNTLWVI